jgi:hypothetical protein
MELSEVISELRKLNQPVPRPFRLPTEAEVRAAEEQLGVRFYEDYRRFLLEASDVVYGTHEPAVVTPDAGHRDLIQMAEAAWDEDGVPLNLLPFCFDNGNYFCMNEAGEVVYWDHNGPTDEKWSNLAAWVKQVWIEGG